MAEQAAGAGAGPSGAGGDAAGAGPSGSGGLQAEVESLRAALAAANARVQELEAQLQADEDDPETAFHVARMRVFCRRRELELAQQQAQGQM